MEKKTGLKQWLSSAPLPDIVWEAFASIPRGEDHIRHTVYENGKKTRVKDSGDFLHSDTHSFYIGKVIQENISEKIGNVLGFKRKEKSKTSPKIYTIEYIESILDYLSKHLVEGQKGQIVIARYFSEILNGKDEMQKAYTLEELKAKIYKIAKKKFNMGKSELDVVGIEEQPLHQDFFAEVLKNIDSETGQVEHKKVLESDQEIKLSKDSSSLEIARYLYRASQRNEYLKEMFDDTVPFDFEEDSPAQYYGLLEVANRLTEILNGRNIHGGVNRQSKYDNIIVHIIKGKKKLQEDLKELSDLFKGVRFETIHINTKESPFQIKKERILAWTRISIMVALGFMAGKGLLMQGEKIGLNKAKEVQELKKERLLSAIKCLYNTIDGPKFMLTDSEEIYQACLRALEKMKIAFKERYKIPPAIYDANEALLIDFIIEHPDKNYLLDKNKRIDIVDQFIYKHKFLFITKGYQVEKPYTHLFKYKKEFDDFLQSEKEDETVYKPIINTSLTGGVNDPAYIGTINPAEEYKDKFRLYMKKTYPQAENRFEINNKTPIVKIYAEKTFNNRNHAYSTKLAKEGIKEFYESIKRADTVPLFEHRQYFRDILQKVNNPESADYKEDYEIKKDYSLTMLPDYADSFGEFFYEMAIYNQFIETKKGYFYKHFLVARKAGETNFTTKSALEAAKIWHYASKSHLSEKQRTSY